MNWTNKSLFLEWPFEEKKNMALIIKNIMLNMWKCRKNKLLTNSSQNCILKIIIEKKLKKSLTKQKENEG